MNEKNVVYSETSWPFIFPVILLYLGLVIAGVYFKGLEFRTYLAIAVMIVASCYIFLLYWRYAIQIDDTTISIGYHFTGKEKVLLNIIEYAEILIFDRKNPTTRFAINRLGGSPVRLTGRLIRLRLKEEYLTRYKLKRKKKVKQLVLVSRDPESVLSVLSEKGVPVQRMRRQGTE